MLDNIQQLRELTFTLEEYRVGSLARIGDKFWIAVHISKRGWVKFYYRGRIVGFYFKQGIVYWNKNGIISTTPGEGIPITPIKFGTPIDC